MKYLFTFFFLLFLNSDKKKDLNYNLLIGSWYQHSFAGTTSTGVFTFAKDSTATLEMRDGKTQNMIGGMQGPYKIEKSKKILKITMVGKQKTFEIHELTDDVLVLQNQEKGKSKQTYKRYKDEK
jgi:hypothetical protein